jgi:hypothetical protein
MPPERCRINATLKDKTTMLQCIHLDPKVDKCLDTLRRSGKKAGLAAARAEEIIERLTTGGTIPDRVGTVTRHGELRIPGVMKYDLGSGYRLVTFKQGPEFYLLFAGTHDDCHRWIENNRELPLELIKARCRKVPVAKPDHLPVPDKSGDAVQEDDDPLATIAERDLRRVFSGLLG